MKQKNKQSKKALHKKNTTQDTSQLTSPKNTIPHNDSWLSQEVFAKLAVLFILVQTLGVVVAANLLKQGINTELFPDPNNPANAFFLFLNILVMTAVILLILRFRKKSNFLWILEGISLFASATIVFTTLYPNADVFTFGAIALLLFIRYTNRTSVLIRNVAGMIAIAGAGALIGISLGIIPVLMFIIALALYDIIAVFGTKHMLELGKAVTNRNFAFTIAIPSKKHTFELGNGDLVIPLVVAASILANGAFVNNILVAALCLGASYLGLVSSLWMVSVKKISMPALPPQTFLMLIVIAVAMLLKL